MPSYGYPAVRTSAPLLPSRAFSFRSLPAPTLRECGHILLGSCSRKVGALGLLSRRTVAHLGHRQHFGSGLFGGYGLRRCSALLGEASKLIRLSARHGHLPFGQSAVPTQ